MAKKKRLIWQLYPSYLLIIIISLLAVSWYASISTKDFFLKQMESDLEARAVFSKSLIFPFLQTQDNENIDLICKDVGKQTSTRITVILPSGMVVGDTESNPGHMDNHADRPEFIGALSGESGTSTRFSNTLNKRLMYVGIPVRRGEKILAVVRTSIPIDVIDMAIREIQRKIVIGGVICALFAAIVSLYISRRISRPIETLQKSAGDFAKGDFQRWVTESNIHEIWSLYDAMKNMAQELHNRINMVSQQRNEIEAMLSSMVEGVIAVDMDERVISMNNAAAQMLKWRAAEAQGHSIQEIVRNSALQDFVKKALSRTGQVEEEIELSLSREVFVNGHGTALNDAEGNQIGALIVLNDISRLRKLENIRKEFVANVSHEIKTPITAIKGFVETLRGGSVKETQDVERFLGIIGKHVNRLEAIIEDLLSLSRIEKEAETEGIELLEFRIKDIIETAIQVCGNKAELKDIDIRLESDGEISAKINPPLLEQAVVNLLDNAIKYSPSGSHVQVDVEQKEEEIIISVRDQGCGIEKAHLPRLFERFYRVDKSRSRQLGGTGLGLAIVKHIVQSHGGTVLVQSEPEKGSIFSIHLPFHRKTSV